MPTVSSFHVPELTSSSTLDHTSLSTVPSEPSHSIEVSLPHSFIPHPTPSYHREHNATHSLSGMHSSSISISGSKSSIDISLPSTSCTNASNPTLSPSITLNGSVSLPTYSEMHNATHLSSSSHQPSISIQISKPDIHVSLSSTACSNSSLPDHSTFMPSITMSSPLSIQTHPANISSSETPTILMPTSHESLPSIQEPQIAHASKNGSWASKGNSTAMYGPTGATSPISASVSPSVKVFKAYPSWGE